MAFVFPYFKALLAPLTEFSLRLIANDNMVNDVIGVTKNEESHFLIGISNFE